MTQDTRTESHDTLPALPEPAHRGPTGTGDYFSSYTADQMHAYARAHAAQQAAEVQALRAEVAQLKLAEEGAKVAFGHVVQMKRDAEAARDKTHANLDAAHAIIRQQARAARQDGAGGQG